MAIPRVSNIRLAIPVAGATLAAAAFVLAAMAPTPAAASNCRRLKHVKSFHGHISFNFDGSASGSDPDSGGTETIDLHEHFQGVEVKLHRLPSNPALPNLHQFVGDASGGNVSVQDSFENTGTGLDGQATYSGPVSKNGGAAGLTIGRKTCHYRLDPGFYVKPKFSGDSDVNPGFIGFSTEPNIDGVGQGLTLKDDQTGALLEIPCGDADRTYMGSCFNLETNWLGDYFRLKECGSLDVSKCKLTENDPIGHGDTHWHLRPKF
jgi:hypothetical protein